MAEKGDGGASIVYFLFGAAVGAALGLLLAPKTGQETREDLARWLDSRRRKAAEDLHRFREESGPGRDRRKH